MKPHQYDFLKGTELYPGLFGGVGNGKTWAACLRCIELATQNPGNLGLVGRLTYPELRDSTREVFLQVLALFYPPKAYKLNKAENTIELYNKSLVLFRHLENPSNLLGPNLGFFYIDQAEEVDEDAFLTLQSRLRRPNVNLRQGMVTGNPAGMNWIYYKWGLDKLPSAEGFFNWSYNEDYRMVNAPTFANMSNLPPDYIPQLKRSYSEEWFQRYVMASWTTFEGQIFDIYKISGYDRDKLPEIMMVLVGCDPAISKETTASNTVFCTLGVGKDGHIYDLNTLAGKWGFFETLEVAQRVMMSEYGITKIRPSYLGVENVAYQQSLLEACQEKFPQITVIDVKADKDKYRRAKSVSHIISQGLFHTNDGDLLAELTAFRWDQKGKEKKDRVDAMVHALHMIQKYAPLKFVDENAEKMRYVKMSSSERFLKLSQREEKLEAQGLETGEQVFDPGYKPVSDEYY